MVVIQPLALKRSFHACQKAYSCSEMTFYEGLTHSKNLSYVYIAAFKNGDTYSCTSSDYKVAGYQIFKSV